MILKYLIERRNWILLLFGLQGISLLIAYVDQALSFSSLLYMVGLNVLIIVCFLIVSYLKETRYYKSLLTWDHTYELGEIEENATPFEQIVHHALQEQTLRYKQQIHTNVALLEQEKDELLAWIHEVKTPLTAMSLMLDRVDDISLKSELSYEWLRIHHLLDQQLHQKRIPFMKNDLVMGLVKLEDIFHLEIQGLRSWCMAKGIGFELEFEVEQVVTDEKWLGFIVRQLLTNAVKYSTASDIVIRSYKGKDMNEGKNEEDSVKLSISDQGRGILEKDIPRIFDKGFTSSNGRQQGDASGVGLYLAKQVVDALNIQLDVSSVWGKGSTFTLTFSQKNKFLKVNGM
jgi:OmpR family two-component system bacitracin resistance sensor histidine kinase BceS